MLSEEVCGIGDHRDLLGDHEAAPSRRIRFESAFLFYNDISVVGAVYLLKISLESPDVIGIVLIDINEKGNCYTLFSPDGSLSCQMFSCLSGSAGSLPINRWNSASN